MGFYIDLVNAGEGVYREDSPPHQFWVLYAVAAFAMGCMGGAAYPLALTRGISASGGSEP